MLELRELGTTGLQIPPLVFGATSLGNLFREVADNDKSEIVRQWFDCGTSPVVIDTAGKYGAGLSLEVIGRELHAQNIPSNAVIISNKLGWRRVPLMGDEPTFEPGAWFGLEYDAIQDISYDGILRCWREGNELLGGIQTQLVSVHDPDEYLAAATDPSDRKSRLQDIIDAYRALMDLKKTGQVKAVGIGAKQWQVIQELSNHCVFDWVMFANSLTIMHHPPELVIFVDSLASSGVGVINSALFHGGFLLGGDFFDYRKVDENAAGDVRRLDWRQRFWDVCKRYGVSPFHVGTAFGRAHPGVSAVALSSSRPERIASHIRAVAEPLSTAVWDELETQGLIRAGMFEY